MVVQQKQGWALWLQHPHAHGCSLVSPGMGYGQGREEPSLCLLSLGLLTAATWLLRGLCLRGHDLEDCFQDAPQVTGKVGLELIGHPCTRRGGSGCWERALGAGAG